MFNNELSVLARLRHPHLLRLRGYCVHGARGFLITDLAPGGSLAKRLRRPGAAGATGTAAPPLDAAQRLAVALGVTQGLRALHRLTPAVLHRDLKPENILLDGDSRPLVADFGISRSAPELGGGSTHVSSRQMGTMGFIAPEARSVGHYSPKSDVYALGVVLLQLLTSRDAIVLPDDAPAGMARPKRPVELPAFVAQCLKPGRPPSDPANSELFVAGPCAFSPEVLDGLTPLALRCTDAEPELRPNL